VAGNPVPINASVYYSYNENTAARGGLYPSRTSIYSESVPRPFGDPGNVKDYPWQSGKAKPGLHRDHS